MSQQSDHLNKIYRRIAGLLEQSENTSSEAEAAAFAERAQALMTQYSVEAHIARQATELARGRGVETPVSEQVEIGKPRQRGLHNYISLFTAIALNNGVRINIARNSTYVVLFGYTSDILLVKELYLSLVSTMTRMSTEYVETTPKEEWGASKITARLSFQSGFANRVAYRLTQAREKQECEMQQKADDSGETSTALVVQDRSQKVEDFYKSKSTARGTYRGAQRAKKNAASFGALAAGDEAGRRASITRTDTEKLAGAAAALNR